MERVTGIGGVFFRAGDPERLAAWYELHLAILWGANSDSGLEFYAAVPRRAPSM
jgi:hypothetical protein